MISVDPIRDEKGKINEILLLEDKNQKERRIQLNKPS